MKNKILVLAALIAVIFGATGVFASEINGEEVFRSSSSFNSNNSSEISRILIPSINFYEPADS